MRSQNILRFATLSVAGLLIINILLSQRETSISIDTGVPPPGPISSSQPPSPPPAPDAVHRCANMARNYRVVPGVSWGTLSEAQKVRWKSLNCDGIITLDVLLERRGGLAGGTAAQQRQSQPLPNVVRASTGAGVATLSRKRVPGPAVSVYFGGLGGYQVFRIPALIRAARMLLAFAEARPTVDDHGRIDLVVRRSIDGGRTWGPLVVVAKGQTVTGGSPQTMGNPVPIYLKKEGLLLLLYCSNAAHVTEDAIRGGVGGVGRRVWMIKSFDSGTNWTAPVELTPTVKQSGWTWYATGPGGAIVTRNGSLVVPATHASGEGPVGSGMDHSHVLLSDDNGETWRLGGSSSDPHTNEATIAQVADGSLLLNSRDLSTARQRVLQTSVDGGVTWGAPRRAPELEETPPRGCHGSMVSTPLGETLFFAAPSSPTAREKITVHRSDDGGRTWPKGLVLWEGPSAYSSMRLLPGNSHLGVLYERGETATAFFAQKIVFERVKLGEESPLGAVAAAAVPPAAAAAPPST